MKLYISDGALLLLAIVYLPVVVTLLRALWRKMPQAKLLRISVMATLLVAALALPLWDVVITSAQMAKLCSHAGVFINNTATVNGYIKNTGGKEPLSRGFTYVELLKKNGYVTVYSKRGDVVHENRFPDAEYQPQSQYEFIENLIYGQRLDGYLNIDMDRSVVRDRLTQTELGYSVRYHAYPGWFDRVTFSRITQLIGRCPVGGDAQEGRLEHETLLPK